MTVAPERKFVPARFVIETLVVLAPVAGVMPVTVGAGAADVDTFTHVTCVEMFVPSEFVAFSLIV